MENNSEEGAKKDGESPDGKKAGKAEKGDKDQRKSGKGDKHGKGDKQGKGQGRGEKGSGKDDSKGGEKGGEKKDAQWKQKADGEGDDGDGGKKGRGGAKGEKGDGKDSRNRDGRKERDKKETWNQRRGKHEKGDGKDDGDGGKSGSPLSGGALLSMLKANPPSYTRYTKEELLSIGQLAASRNKPSNLDILVDKENASSPLLVRARGDKAQRKRGGDAEGDEEYDDGVLQDRAEEEADGDDDHRGRKGGQRGEWKDDRRPMQQWSERGLRDSNRSAADRAALDRRKADPWDMPESQTDVLEGNDLTALSMGDIRQAEKAMSKGMSMSDYKDSLQRPGARNDRDAADDSKDDPFADEDDGANEGFFMDDEDAPPQMRESRGFGKWFGGRTAQDTVDTESSWMAPGIAPLPSEGQLGEGSQRNDQHGALEPPSMSSIESLLNEEDSRPVQGASHSGFSRTGTAAPSAEVASSATGGSSDPAGKSILSMLGQQGDGTASPQGKQGKLSVAELFDSARGKELPPVPQGATEKRAATAAATGAAGGGVGIGAGEESAEARMQREVLRMAQTFMWAAAAKAGQTPMPPGAQMPGYPPGYGANPASFGMGGGRGAESLQQAYAQAMAMHGRSGGYGGNFSMNGPGGRGGRGGPQSWAPPHPGFVNPYGAGMPPYGYPGYGVPPQVPRAPFGGNQQGFGTSAAGYGGAQPGMTAPSSAAATRGGGRGQAQGASGGQSGPAAAGGKGAGGDRWLEESAGAYESASKAGGGEGAPKASEDGQEEDAGCSQN